MGQGDSIFIKLPYNQGNILIDTGGVAGEEQTNSGSITDNKLIPYLYSLGITKLDHLILTHGDTDHMKESLNFIKKFKIKNVIFNKGEYNTLEQKLIFLLKEQRISYKKSQKKLNIHPYNFYFLNQTIYEDENQNSNIIYFNYKNYNFLLLGDASIKNEEEFLSKYKITEIDFLKVGHHGSSTSTSQLLIEKTNPKISLISVGANNWYGHPTNVVLEKLKNSEIYRTDQDGSIVIEIGNICSIKTYSPKRAVNSRKGICV